jgi:hypothetical protein
METIEINLKLNLLDCCSCGAPIVLSEALERSLRESHRSFYCPSGHTQNFPGATEADKLRKALSAAEIEKTRLTQQATAAQAETERLRKRISHGVCPCCKRSFKQLAAHMNRKHPDYGKE